jgi:hypothetical protein
LLLSLAVQHQSGLEISLSLSLWCCRSKVFHEVDHCHQPLLDVIRTLINSHVWNSTAHCKVIAWLPTPTNTSNLSLDRDPTGGTTNSREIQRGYTHFSATLYNAVCKNYLNLP